MLDLFALRELAPGSRVLGTDSYECATSDILVLDGVSSRVLWLSSGGDRVVRLFTCECPPLDAVFCSFEKDTVCVAILLTPSYLRLHQASGEHHDVRLSTPCLRIFAVPSGLLLRAEPSPDPPEEDLTTLNATQGSPSGSPGPRSPDFGLFAADRSSPSGFSLLGPHRHARPTLFTLAHPTAVAVPVALRSSVYQEPGDESMALAEADAEEPLHASHAQTPHPHQLNHSRSHSVHVLDGLFTSEHEEVVAVCGPLLITLQGGSGSGAARDNGSQQQPRTLRLWALQAVAEEETNLALATMRATGASLGSRMSLGSRSSRGSGGYYGAGQEGEAGPGAFAHGRSKSPSFAPRSSPITASSSNPSPYGWDNAVGDSVDRGGSPIVGLQNALGLDGTARRGVEREGGDAGGPGPLLTQFVGSGGAVDAGHVGSRDAARSARNISHITGRSSMPGSSLQLLDSSPLGLAASSRSSSANLRFSFSGSRLREHSSPLVLTVLDPVSGASALFAVEHAQEEVGGLDGGPPPAWGELRALPPLTLPAGQVPRAVAHARVPMFLGGGAATPSACLTIILHSRAALTAPSAATLFIGSSRVGSTALHCLDDLDSTSANRAFTDMQSLGGGALVTRAAGRSHLVALPPALLLEARGGGAAELAALAAVQSLPGGDTAAELGLGLFMLAQRLGHATPATLLLRAAFGLPAPAAPAANEPRATNAHAELVLVHARLVPLLAALDARVPLFDALHAAWQDLRIQGSRHVHAALEALGAGLAGCAASAGGATGHAYHSYYSARLDLSTIQLITSDISSGAEFTAHAVPPCASQWVAQCLDLIGQQFASRTAEQALPVFHTPARGCPCIDLCRKFLQRVLMGIQGVAATSLARLIAESYMGTGMGVPSSEPAGDPLLQNISLLPPLLRQVVELALYECREAPNEQWTDVVLQKIGRYDLCKNWKSGISRSSAESSGASSGPMAAQTTVVPPGAPAGSAHQAPPSDGLREVEAAALLRFADDDRMHEACRLLRSSESIYLRVDKAPETSDLDHRHRMQLRLLTLCRRSLACCVGRGALTMGSLQPLMAEALPVPPLNLSGRVPPSNGLVHLDTTSAPPELTLWPEFHNGVAAGLRVGRGSKQIQLTKGVGQRSPADNGRHVTRNWILYNRTATNAAAAAAARGSNTAGVVETAMASHAGVLLALGLQGHLHVLSKNDICDYLSQGHEHTTVAMLLGMAASKVGAADARLSKTLCLYLPTLLPQRHQDIDISPLVQTAALAGLGLLHVGSGHRLMTEFLLAELSRRPTSDRCDTRESSALTAAWALGLVLLGKGAERGADQGLGGLVDLHIEDRLVQHFTGGRKPPESYLFPTVSASAGDAAGRASRVLEGGDINTDITGPGALVALALIYLGSNNADIAKRMALPQTVFALDSLRPDMLLYRATAICLVMWNSVTPSASWIEAQVPAAIRRALFKDEYGRKGASKSATSASGSRENSAPEPCDDSARFGGNQNGVGLRPKVALAAYLCVISGYGFGMGLVFAGSGDSRAKKAIHAQLHTLQALRDNKSVAGLAMGLVDKSMRPLIDMCVCCLSVSLATVMAGTGDVDCLRTFRELRKRVDEVAYGTHLALSQAVGMLFLGGGTCSVRRDPLSIACLLISLCPRYPARSVDNQYHLQPLRHLYVLAVESRVLRTIDVDTGRAVSVDVKIELASGDCMHARAPCLLPELETVLAVRVNPPAVPSYAGGSTPADVSLASAASGTSVASRTSLNSSTGNVRGEQRSLFVSSTGTQGNGHAAQRANDFYPTGLLVASGAAADKALEVQPLCIKKRVPRAPSNCDEAGVNQPSARVQAVLSALLDPFGDEAEAAAAGGGTYEPPSLEASQGNELTLELLMNMLSAGKGEVDSIMSASVSTCGPLVQLLCGEHSTRPT